MSMFGGIGGSALGRVLVEVGLDARPLEKGMATAKGQVAAGGSKIGTTMSTAIKAGAILAGAAVIKFGADSVAAFQESEEAGLKLANTLQNNAKLSDVSTASWEAQSHALQELTGIQDEEITVSQAMLGQFDLTGQQVQDLLPLIVDLSQKMGIDLATATKAVGKATDGSTGSLSRYGVKIDAGKDGVVEFGDVMSGLTQKVGGFSKSISGTFSTRMAVLAANFDDVKESVGQALVPVLEDLTGILNAMMPAIQFAAEHWQLILGAFLAFKAVGFLPDLLAKIAVGFTKMNLGSAANGVNGLKNAMSGGMGTTALWAAAAVVAAEDINLLTGLLTGNLDAYKKYVEVVPPAAGTLDHFADILNLITPAEVAARTEMQHTTGAVQSEAAAHRDAAAAANAHRTAELALAGGFIGVQAAASQLKDAQRELNKLEAEGKTKTQEYKDAQTQAFQAFLSLNGAAQEYSDSLREGGATSAQAKAALQAMAGQLGISKGALAGYVGQIDSAISRQSTFNSLLNSMPTHKDVTITTTYQTVGTPGSGGGNTQ